MHAAPDARSARFARTTASTSSIGTGRRVAAPRARRDRAVPSRPRALGPHGASRRRARPARLRLLRLGRARPRPLARRARRFSPSFAHVGARRADLRRPHRREARHRARGHRRRSRRASARCWSPTWVHDYAPPIRGMVLASPAFKVKLYVPFARAGLALMHKLRGNFFVNCYVKAKFLTHDPGAHRELRRRSADHAADLGQHPARPLRRGRARRRRCAGDHRADAAADLRRRLGGASRAAARVLRPAGLARSRSATCCPASIHDTLGERDRGAGGRSACARSSCACSRSRPHGRTCATPTSAATRATRPTRWPRRCPRCRRAACTGRRRAPSCGSAACCRTACGSGHATGFDSGSTLDYVYRNHADGRHAARPPDRPQLPRLDRLARHPPAQAPCRGAAARRRSRDLRAAGAARCASSTSPPATAATCSRRSPAAGAAPDSILLRDYSEINVATGRGADREKGLDRHRALRAGDAFDRASLAALEPQPDARRRLRPLRAVPRQRAGARARSPAWPTRSRRAAISSTPASPGIRSSS